MGIAGFRAANTAAQDLPWHTRNCTTFTEMARVPFQETHGDFSGGSFAVDIEGKGGKLISATPGPRQPRIGVFLMPG
jgi:hypothetical protein